MSYEFFPHTGDLGVRVWGDSFESLAASAARAFLDAQTDPEAVRVADAVILTCRAPELDLVLHDFLSDLLFQFDARHRLVCDADIAVTRDGDLWVLDATTRGELYDPARHPIKVLIKGVTYHALAVAQTALGWEGTVVFDI